MDPREIIPEKLKMSQIRDIAEKFRKEKIFNFSIPVDIEHVIESTMGINIIPVKDLQHDCDLEGFISRDFSSIYVDEDLYLDDRYYKRVRFTIAHEIGHLVLHRSNIDMVRFLSEADWKNFRAGLNDEPLGWFETQASEFAGRLLVPLEELVDAFKQTRSELMKKHTSWADPDLDEDEIILKASTIIAPRFDVSSEVIEKRLRKENVLGYLAT
jgi:Zn-dependent peptidase ImmA (M78 family)